MKKILTTLFLLSFIAASSQQTATTSEGKKVLLSTDGTWKYAEVKKDTFQSGAVNCDDWTYIHTDKMSNSSIKAAKIMVEASGDGGSERIAILLMQGSSGGLIMVIQTAGAGSCIDKGDKINILFMDGSRMDLASQGEFNCKGKATVYFGGSFGKKTELQELIDKKIQTIRVWTSDSYVEEDFTSENQSEFSSIINCLTK